MVEHRLLPGVETCHWGYFDAKTPPVGAVVRGELFQTDYSVCNAMDRLVMRFAGEIVQHHHGRPITREIMLQRQYLPAVAQ